MQVFRATLNGFRSDKDGESVISVRVPKKDYQRAAEVGARTDEVFVVTIMTEDEFFKFSDQLLGEGE